MPMSLPKGTYVPVVTPFTVNQTLDFAGLDRLVDRLLRANVEAIVVMGTTGESATVTTQEFTQLIRHTITRVDGAAAVLAGIGSNDTRTSIRQANNAENLGVDGLLVVCPYYTRPTQQGLYEHFKLIAEQVSIPQLVYNIAGRTGVNIETETLLRLAQLQHIVGVKESSDNIEQMSDVLRQLPEDFLVLCGCDHLNLASLCLGGHGVISTVANLSPAKVKAMVDAAHNNELDTARQIHFELHQLTTDCFVESNPIPVKTALALMGEIQEVFRSPLCTMNTENRTRWISTLRHYGLLDSSGSGLKNLSNTSGIIA